MVVRRALSILFVSFLDVLFYSSVLEISLRMGPGGLGPRVFQLALAICLPASFTYAVVRKKKRRDMRRILKLTLGMVAAGALTPGSLEPLPALSLAAASAIGSLPFWAGRMMGCVQAFLARTVMPFERTVGSHRILDLLLFKRTRYFLRCIPYGGQEAPADASVGSSQYKFVRATDFTMRRTHRKSLRRAAELVRLSTSILVPASEPEVDAIVRGTGLDDATLKMMEMEAEHLHGLSVARVRRMSCALKGEGVTADVMISLDGGNCTIKVLSGGEVEMDRSRLKDLLDIYGMFASKP